MFGKQIVEACTILAYWVLFVPSVLIWKGMDVGKNPLDYFFTHTDQAIYFILGYLVLYHIIIFIYIQLKSLDLGLWHTLTKASVEVEIKLEEVKTNYANLDTVDGPSIIHKKALPASGTLSKKSPLANPSGSTCSLNKKAPLASVASHRSPRKPAPPAPLPLTTTLPRVSSAKWCAPPTPPTPQAVVDVEVHQSYEV